ncbi:DUF4270 family protein [Euzebyella marina]|uniref:DUF4270 family protein n=1 Tax=Euzebyella marina TaxID=1761453 RepID=A0A3G2L2N8_9FLAO|nr:DUF4270 family protein [Euzebyella marina]AYN66515.1 DUF4270 family protein [Euzebyella marina]
MIRLSLASLLILIIVLACSTEGVNESNFEAGDTFTSSNIRVVQLDTATVLMSTIKYDSIITSETTRILVGRYEDPVFGVVESSSYLELLPDGYTIDSEAVFDSLVFYLKHDGYFYNDTLTSLTISFEELSQKLSPSDDGFYNSSNITTKGESLGVISFYPRPNDADSLSVKLNDSLGVGLFENFQSKSIVNSDELKEYFKGFRISAENNNGPVMGYSLSGSGMRLFFSVAEENDVVQDYIDFSINQATSPPPFFNEIIAKEPIEALRSFTSQEENRYSRLTGNQSYIQSGVGIATRIEFPHIQTIHDIGGEGTLLGAVLKVRPTVASYNDLLMLRDTLLVFLVDQNNDITEQLSIEDIASVQGILNRNDEEFNNIYYEIPISSYVEELLLGMRDEKEALLLIPNDFNTSVDRYVLTDGSNNESRTSLEITYAVYGEDE